MSEAKQAQYSLEMHPVANIKLDWKTWPRELSKQNFGLDMKSRESCLQNAPPQTVQKRNGPSEACWTIRIRILTLSANQPSCSYFRWEARNECRRSPTCERSSLKHAPSGLLGRVRAGCGLDAASAGRMFQEKSVIMPPTLQVNKHQQSQCEAKSANKNRHMKEIKKPRYLKTKRI